MLRTTLLAAAAAAVFAAPAVAATTAPKVTKVSLETVTDNAAPKGSVAIYFRTDGAVARKGNGSIDGTAGLKKAGQASIGTFNKKTRCYVAYVKAPTLKAGKTSPVHIALDGHDVAKTLTVKAGANGKSIGC